MKKKLTQEQERRLRDCITMRVLMLKLLESCELTDDELDLVCRIRSANEEEIETLCADDEEVLLEAIAQMN